MKGLVTKDIILVSKYFKNIYFILSIIIACILSFTIFKDEFLMISILMVFLFINFNSNLFIEDEHSGWLTFIKTNTNIKNYMLVLGRYITIIFLTIVINFFFFIITLLHNSIYHSQSFKGLIIITATTLIISLVYMILATPFIYLFLQHGIIVLMVFLTVFIVICKKFLHFSILNDVFRLNNFSLILFGFLILFITFTIGYILSVFILNNKLKE
ncbi:hypothetical protein CW743_13710 [Staphylococcus shinii]|uniref:ABC-2 transporter permease n=1 Tax=Staphylococcus shinii TaxID=2912228 RepID=UPI000C327E84|nr:hypothetical protein CW743_13710 [Staphylococcus shinii]